MIEFAPKVVKEESEALKRLRSKGMSADEWTDAQAKAINREALRLAARMQAIHGGKWSAQIEHEMGLIVIRAH